MSEVGYATRRRAVRPLVLAAALSAVLAGCGGTDDLRVSAALAPPPAAASPAPASKFQGSVTSVDADGRTFVVAVQIVWTPVMEATAHDRRVLVDAGTRWDAGPLSLTDLRPGEEVQVEADPAGDDWRASRVQLFDVD
jgi:hypothetical protein